MAEPKDVFVIDSNGDKTFWHKCGVAFTNRDGSINVKLDLFTNVQFQIRDKKESDPK